MTLVAIQQASAAITIASSFTKELDAPQPLYAPQSGYHWSIYFLGLGTVVGTVTAIAALILGPTSLLVTASLLAITNCLGSYYISQLSIYKDLEFYVSILSKKVHSLATFASKIKESNSQLCSANVHLDASIKKYADSELQQEIKLQSHISSIQELISSLTQANTHLEQLTKLADQEKQTADALKQQTQALQAENSHLKELVSSLSDDIKKLGESQTSVESDVTAINAVARDLALDSAAISQLVTLLPMREAQAGAASSIAQEDADMAASLMLELDHVRSDLVTTLSETADQESSLEELTRQFKANSREFARFDDLLRLAVLLQEN